MKKIRFKRRLGMYENVINSMIDPIIKYIPKEDYMVMNTQYSWDKRTWEGKPDSIYFDISFFSDVFYQHGLFISHGIADKCYRDAQHMRLFDYVGVSGALWVDKLIKQGLDKKKIKIIGYPKLDPIFQNRQIHNSENEKINVLYAPTHNVKPDNSLSTSSYPRLMPELTTLYDEFNIRVSNHPVNKTEHNITFNDLEWADVVISDCSSLLYEAWALDIPVVFPDWVVKNNILRGFNGSFEEDIYIKKIGYHADNINQMKEFIYYANQNGIDEQTKQFSEGILPSYIKGKSGEITSELLMDFIGR